MRNGRREEVFRLLKFSMSEKMISQDLNLESGNRHPFLQFFKPDIHELRSPRMMKIPFCALNTQKGANRPYLI